MLTKQQAVRPPRSLTTICLASSDINEARIRLVQNDDELDKLMKKTLVIHENVIYHTPTPFGFDCELGGRNRVPLTHLLPTLSGDTFMLRTRSVSNARQHRHRLGL